VTVEIHVPGADRLSLDHLVLDLNGTVTNRGRVIDGVGDRLRELNGSLRIHVASADTFGTAARVADQLGATLHRIALGEEKQALVEALGASHTVAIGNGANDALMLRRAALGIGVLGPEGTSTTVLLAADLVVGSIGIALALLTDPLALTATLRP
jgi:P-type E1-E2 ATPase